MTAAKLGFFKLIVRDLAQMAAFYETAFGFERVDGFETPAFDEIIFRQGEDPFMFILLSYKSGGPMGDATAHGPTGFVATDIQASIDRAVAAGASLKVAPFDVGTTRVALLDDPEGHEIELIQFI